LNKDSRFGTVRGAASPGGRSVDSPAGASTVFSWMTQMYENQARSGSRRPSEEGCPVDVSCSEPALRSSPRPDRCRPPRLRCRVPHVVEALPPLAGEPRSSRRGVSSTSRERLRDHGARFAIGATRPQPRARPGRKAAKRGARAKTSRVTDAADVPRGVARSRLRTGEQSEPPCSWPRHRAWVVARDLFPESHV